MVEIELFLAENLNIGMLSKLLKSVKFKYKHQGVFRSTELQWWSLKAAAPAGRASTSAPSSAAPTPARTSGISKFQYSVKNV